MRSALAASCGTRKAGHFHDLERQAAIPLLIEEEDYYTPEWAFDDEEWDE